MTNKAPLYFLLAMVVILSSLPMFVSCKKDKDDDDTFTYSTSQQTTLVKGFGLQSDADVLSSLDSVHFTIDYDKGLIYNADSLPVGTNITKLKVIVEFLNTVNSAVFQISGAKVQADTAINYTTSMSQSIDFSGKTLLKVTSADQSQVKEYEIKVLVHKVKPDTLIWGQSWRRDLPGYSSDLTAYKVVEQGSLLRAIAYDGNHCRLLTALTPYQETWTEQEVSLPFIPEVNTLTATFDNLYMLSSDDVLYTSTDGVDWTSCGVTWCALLGAYENKVLGVISDGDTYIHDEYPRDPEFLGYELDEDFPIAHSSDMIVVYNSWSVAPQAMIVGGIDRNGNFLKDTWGYDGNHWGKINNIHSDVLPKMADATLFSYYTFKSLSGVRRYARQSTWYLMGGRMADGTLNSDIYLSNTKGVTWTEADTTMVQPNFMPRFYGAQAIVGEETLSAPSRMPSRAAAAMMTWNCPYIYLFGGYNVDGNLLPNVWRGVYNRLTNTPLY